MEKSVPPRVYENPTASAAVWRVELVRVGKHTHALITLPVTYSRTELEAWFAQGRLSYQMIGESLAASGSTLCAVQLKDDGHALLELLTGHGQQLVRRKPLEKITDPWVWRGITSVVGQSLTLASGFLAVAPPGKDRIAVNADRAALMSFAGLNLIANAVNVTFGSQKKEDTHQLTYLAGKTNSQLQQMGEIDLPDAKSALAPLPEEGNKKDAGQKLYETLQKYSVSGGEIGLRTLGATALVFPVTRLKSGVDTLGKTKSWSRAFKAIKNPNPVTFYAGIATLAGKFTSFASKEADPFNPEPATMLDTLREKITWPLSSVIEGVAAGFMTHDRFANQKIKIGGKQIPDYLGGVGNSIFIGGYGIRLSAPYGSREVDLKKLYHHAARGIVQLPEAQQPQAILTLAQQFAQHFNRRDTHNAAVMYEGLNEALQQQRMQAPHTRIQDAVLAEPMVATVPERSVK